MFPEISGLWQWRTACTADVISRWENTNDSESTLLADPEQTGESAAADTAIDSGSSIGEHIAASEQTTETPSEEVPSSVATCAKAAGH